jgi:hypothetical protein
LEPWPEAAAPVPAEEPVEDEPDMPEEPDVPELELLPDEEEPVDPCVSHLFDVHFASPGLRPAHFGFDAPEEPAMLPLLLSMELLALLSPVLLVVLPSEPEVEPLLFEAPEPLSDEPLPEVELAPLPYELPVEELEPLGFALWLVVALLLVLLFLCLRSPIASADVLARAMIEVTTNAGASLRIWPPIGL